MNATFKIISPVDGSVYAERPLADDKTARATLERARAAQREWRHVPVAERVRIGTAFTDAMVADTPRVSELLAWQMGRPIRYGPGEMRGFEERARYMLGGGAGDARRHRRRAEGGLQALYPPRAAGRRAQSAGVELPLHDRAQCGAAGDPRRQHGGHEAFQPDRAGRGALRRLLQQGGTSPRRLPVPAHVPRDHRQGDPLRPRRSGRLHRLDRRRAADHGRGRRRHQLSRDLSRTRRQGPGLCAARRQYRLHRRERRRCRFLQFRPVVLRRRAHLRPRGRLRRLPGGGGRHHQRLRAGLAGRPGHDARAGRAHQGGRFRARPGRGGEAPGRQAADRRKPLRQGRGRHALSRAAASGRRRSFHGDHDRGDLRARRMAS